MPVNGDALPRVTCVTFVPTNARAQDRPLSTSFLLMSTAALFAFRLPRLRGRVLAVLLASVFLHLALLHWAQRGLDFDLPPPPTSVTVELFTLPAPVAVGRTPQQRPPAPPPRAISTPPPVSVDTPPASPPVIETAPPEPLPVPATPQDDAAAPAPAVPVVPETARGESALEATIVTFPRFGRFVSDTVAGSGLARLLGTTVIEWRVDTERYTASSVTADDAGNVFLRLTSEGRVEPAFGIAPERYVEKRITRAPVATNFQWDAGKVTFSGNNREVALRPGVQDQLSFLAQLALIAQAFPDRLQPGMSVALEVASARDVRVYDLRVVGWEVTRTQLGLVDTLKLERALPEGAKDARIELWLAPTLHWLPARTRTILSNEQTIETVLKEVVIEQ
jgi:hypothetical protein